MQLVGHIVTEITSADNEPFGYLSGLSFAPDGGVWVVDSQAETVYIFDVAGNFADRIGRGGDGPGELREPCCITLAHDRLWALSPGRRRINVFDLAGALDGQSANPHRISLSGTYNMLYDEAPVFLNDGESVAVTIKCKDASRDYRQDRRASREVSWSGAVIGESPVPARPQRFAGIGITEAEYPRSVSSLRAIPFAIPFGPTFFALRSRIGNWATVFTEAYDVSLLRPDGTLIGRNSRPDVTGPPLLPEETTSAQATLRSWARQARAGGGRLSVTDPPRTKPPINRIWFDANNRLWVQLSPAGDDPHSRADVYSSEGAFLFRAQ